MNYSFVPFDGLIWIFVYVLTTQTFIPSKQALNSKQCVKGYERIIREILRRSGYFRVIRMFANFGPGFFFAFTTAKTMMYVFAMKVGIYIWDRKVIWVQYFLEAEISGDFNQNTLYDKWFIVLFCCCSATICLLLFFLTAT